MRLWQIIAGILIFKLFDACFALAAMFEINVPIVTFFVAILAWIVLSVALWRLVEGVDNAATNARNG